MARLRSTKLEEDLIRQISDLDQKIAGYTRFLKLAENLQHRLEAEGR